jgi:TRAP-type C4-dicarboxylate transport system permease small subunit
MRLIIERCGVLLFSGLRMLVIALAWIAGFAVLFMMAVTCLDIVLRLVGRPLTGTYDMVRIAGTVGVACAVPYTTAIKGHVAVEFFFQKLGRRGRIAVDTVMRLSCIALFAAMTVQSVRYGISLKAAGQVSATLQWPVFWIPHLIAVCCTATAGVMIFQLFSPGKEMLKP